MKRKTFIKKAAGAVLIGIPAVSLLNCSSDDSGGGNTNPDPVSADCASNGARASAISGNHGHTLVVPSSDIDSGNEKTYSIQGGSGHDHEITLTTNNFAALKDTESIQVVSTSGDSHTHTVTVSCA